MNAAEFEIKMAEMNVEAIRGEFVDSMLEDETELTTHQGLLILRKFIRLMSEAVDDYEKGLKDGGKEKES